MTVLGHFRAVSHASSICGHPFSVYVVTCLHPLAPHPLGNLGPRSFPFIVVYKCVLFATLCVFA